MNLSKVLYRGGFWDLVFTTIIFLAFWPPRGLTNRTQKTTPLKNCFKGTSVFFMRPIGGGGGCSFLNSVQEEETNILISFSTGQEQDPLCEDELPNSHLSHSVAIYSWYTYQNVDGSTLKIRYHHKIIHSICNKNFDRCLDSDWASF